MAKKKISLKDGGTELQKFLKAYQAEFQRDSSSEKGHVYWVPALGQWILVMRKGSNAVITFHAADDCPCQMI